MSMQGRPLISFDWAIKNVLRQKPNFGILEGFLSELLKVDLVITNILESESNSEERESKINKVDILCESASKELMLVELQYNSENDYFHRMLFGASKIIVNFMKEGYKYKEVRKIFSINIVYFDLGQGDDYVYYGKTSFEGIHKHDQLQLSLKQKEMFQYHNICQIFPEYYIIKVNKFNDVAKSSLDEWIYYLKNNSLPENYRARGLEQVEAKLKYLDMDEQARINYDAHQKELAISSNVIETAILEGEARGEARGEAKKEEKIVCNAYKKVKDIAFVAEISSLNNEQVLEILKKNGLM
jgi:predicted transposase/invertase (TIGR01784 family)